MRALLLIPVLLCAPGCVYAPLDLAALGDLGQVQEVPVTAGDPDQKLLLLRIDGEITNEESGLIEKDPATTSVVRRELDLARRDEDVRGVLVRIESTGGGVTASDLIFHELERWKQETGKPVVAWLGDTACSGGYYVALPADEIMAAPTCITGSIGVLAMFPHVQELGDKIGVHMQVIKSGANKDLGSPFRAMQPAEQELLQGMVDGMHEAFVTRVVQARARAGLTREALLPVADGRVFTSAEAERLALIDSVGYLEDAARKLAGFAHLDDPQLIVYERRSIGSLQPTVYSRAGAGLGLDLGGQSGALDRLARTVLPGAGPVMRFQWLPTGD